LRLPQPTARSYRGCGGLPPETAAHVRPLRVPQRHRRGQSQRLF
jgi:hypothetical protein